MEHPDETRVILTSIEADGSSSLDERIAKAIVQEDSAGVPAFKVSQLWGTEDGPCVVGPGVKPDQVIDPWFPGVGGIRHRFFTFMPTPKGGAADGHPPHIEDVQGSDAEGFAEAFDPERPGMHISDTVDFVQILSGEIVLELEGRELLVKEGDIVIMRGGWHNWRNETDRPCTVSSVMVGARRQA